MISAIIYFAIIILVIAIDQISKYLIFASEFSGPIIAELVQVRKCYNTGAAFSFLSGKEWAQTFFIILTFVVIIGLTVYLGYKIFYKKNLTKFSGVAYSLIIGGAIGNLIDRLAFQKVRDFINVFYNTDIFTAVFNIADSALVIGVIMLIIHFLFLDEEALFKFKGKKND